MPSNHNTEYSQWRLKSVRVEVEWGRVPWELTLMTHHCRIGSHSWSSTESLVPSASQPSPSSGGVDLPWNKQRLTSSKTSEIVLSPQPMFTDSKPPDHKWHHTTLSKKTGSILVRSGPIVQLLIDVEPLQLWPLEHGIDRVYGRASSLSAQQGDLAGVHKGDNSQVQCMDGEI